MYRLLLFVFLLFFIQKTVAQPTVISGRKPRSLTPAEQKMDDENRNCIHRAQYTVQQRRQFYPFNQAAKVRLVSFNGESDSSLALFWHMPTIKGKVDYSRLKEIKSLTGQEIDSLTDILYNVSWRGPFFTYQEACCFKPRNAILFIDSTGNTFAYIELCFECNNFSFSSKKIKAVSFCEGKYELLRDFFIKRDIQYGTKNPEKYTGETDAESTEP
jgi:hypothetical protein